MLCHVTCHSAQWNSVLVYVYYILPYTLVVLIGYSLVILGSSHGTSHTHSLSLPLTSSLSLPLSLPSYLLPSLPPSLLLSLPPSLPTPLFPCLSLSLPLSPRLSLSNEVFVSVCVSCIHISLQPCVRIQEIAKVGHGILV